MFICQLCNTQQPPLSSPTRVVVQTRGKEYPKRPEANDPGGYGHEIVKELNVCNQCLSKGATRAKTNAHN